MEKKRVFISVDKEAWEGTQRILRECRISNQFYNELLNEFIRGQYKLLVALEDEKKAGKEVTLGSFLRLMGNIVDDLGGEQLKLVK